MIKEDNTFGVWEMVRKQILSKSNQKKTYHSPCREHLQAAGPSCSSRHQLKESAYTSKMEAQIQAVFSKTIKINI